MKGSSAYICNDFWMYLCVVRDLDAVEEEGSAATGEPEAEIAVIENQGEPSRQDVGWPSRVVRWMESNRLVVFWSTLYTLALLGVFTERAYCKS